MYSRTIVRSIASYKINAVIKILILSDFLIFSAYQLFSPLFAIFIVDEIGGHVEAAGITVAIYLIFKSIFEMPVGIFIDKSKSEKDDLWAAILGSILVAMVYFSYIFVDSILQLYVLQAVLGIAAAIAFPGWYTLFTRHVDKGKEGFEWSLYDVLLGAGMAAAAALGGFIVSLYGFEVLFIVAAIITVLGALLLFSIKNKIYTK
ncbi:MAG: hypothetical protein A2543_00745 [Candidatus Komeilibacteria bacterium RIFOXYD2_FULL_37_8]|nr:MAG: hypothetical protein A2543_00745 [Candidatus Komeilibacteria bacterium RIFOXYD2_FULL_37_8]